MRFLLLRRASRTKSISDALVGLLGKPFDECSALCIPTAAYGHPLKPGVAWKFVSGPERPHVRAGLEDPACSSSPPFPASIVSNGARWSTTDVLLANGGDALFLGAGAGSGLAELLPLLENTLRGLTRQLGDDAPHRGGLCLLEAARRRRRGPRDRRLLDLPGMSITSTARRHDANAEPWAAGLGNPAYAIDDDTAIQVTDSGVEIISEGHWKLLTR